VDSGKGTVIPVNENDDISKLNLSTRNATYLIWNKLPENGLEGVLEKVRAVPGGHRTRYKNKI